MSQFSPNSKAINLVFRAIFANLNLIEFEWRLNDLERNYR